MNMDGETNLKDRELTINTVKYKHLMKFSGTVLCDPPNASLDKWEGKVASTQLGRERPCNIKNLLLRGVTLKNTEFAFGICLYVGKQTKIFMNAKKPPQKLTNLMRLINRMLYSVFILQFWIIILFTTASMFWIKRTRDEASYLELNGNLDAKKFIVQFFTYQVAYSHMIPISLYVMIEIAKLFQAKLINSDVKMFFPEDSQYALSRNSDLIEELGQVEFVFSDKTGTLTQNKMEFKKCQVDNQVFGDPSEEDIANDVG